MHIAMKVSVDIAALAAGLDGADADGPTLCANEGPAADTMAATTSQ
jgi:hypothetical protein